MFLSLALDKTVRGQNFPLQANASEFSVLKHRELYLKPQTPGTSC